MKKKYFVLAISAVALIIFLATCNKKQASGKIEQVTYSKNFKSSLTDENIWFDFNFEFQTTTDNQAIAGDKQFIESYYINWLATHQQKQHEIYFKWINLNAEPLKYRLIGYITPPRTKGTNERDAGTMASGDPPIIPSPPPPSGR